MDLTCIELPKSQSFERFESSNSFCQALVSIPVYREYCLSLGGPNDHLFNIVNDTLPEFTRSEPSLNSTSSVQNRNQSALKVDGMEPWRLSRRFLVMIATIKHLNFPSHTIPHPRSEGDRSEIS